MRLQLLRERTQHPCEAGIARELVGNWPNSLVTASPLRERGLRIALFLRLFLPLGILNQFLQQAFLGWGLLPLYCLNHILAWLCPLNLHLKSQRFGLLLCLMQLALDGVIEVGVLEHWLKWFELLLSPLKLPHGRRKLSITGTALLGLAGCSHGCWGCRRLLPLDFKRKVRGRGRWGLWCREGLGLRWIRGICSLRAITLVLHLDTHLDHVSLGTLLGIIIMVFGFLTILITGIGRRLHLTLVFLNSWNSDWRCISRPIHLLTLPLHTPDIQAPRLLPSQILDQEQS